jgi:hypothetical protein
MRSNGGPSMPSASAAVVTPGVNRATASAGMGRPTQPDIIKKMISAAVVTTIFIVVMVSVSLSCPSGAVGFGSGYARAASQLSAQACASAKRADARRHPALAAGRGGSAAPAPPGLVENGIPATASGVPLSAPPSGARSRACHAQVTAVSRS